MTKIGLDLGCTLHKYVLIMADQLVHSRIMASQPIECINRGYLEEVFQTEIEPEFNVYCTGGRSRFVQYPPDLMVEVVDEIAAIAGGGRYFMPEEDRFIAISVGTGTCIVHYDSGRYTHLGGSGIGGGTLQGLSRFCIEALNNQPLSDVFELAQSGQTQEVDITVEDIIGGGIGIVPPDATASHLAKLNRQNRPESVAAGLINMVATEIANLAAFCARSQQTPNIIFLGYLIQHPYFASILGNRIGIINPECRLTFPPQSAFGNALGAVYSAGLSPH